MATLHDHHEPDEKPPVPARDDGPELDEKPSVSTTDTGADSDLVIPRHDFYESDEKLILSIYDKGADREQLNISFEPRKFQYLNGNNKLALEPLKGQIDVEKSTFSVGKVKVEVTLVKVAAGRWGALVGDSPDPLAAFPAAASPAAAASPRKAAFRKNWDGIATEIFNETEEKEKKSDDPNASGDASVNTFFQSLFKDADEDTRRAMMKSYVESGGTTLSTNWSEVGKGRVEVKPPEGSEWKKWAA